MKHSTPILAASLSLTLLFPLIASAHEHRTFTVGEKKYSIVVGSIGEPVYTGDKSGVEIIVTDLSVPAVIQEPMADGDEAAIVPVVGLEKDLKVEVIAGDQRKLFDLKAKYGAPGTYNAVFFPTAQTTYSYRVVGKIDTLPFDVTYTCNPAPSHDAPEDMTQVKIADGVMQIAKGGAFGCPKARSESEFPMMMQSNGSVDRTMVGLVAGILGMLIGIFALLRSGRRQ